MGLFDKKICDFCGGKIGLLGNRKLADGNMCKDCAAKITPYLVGRKQYTVDDMKEHLASREENKQRLASFNATRSLGLTTKVHIDDGQQLLLVSSSRSYKNENPDIVEFTQVTGCVLDINETKTEVMKDAPDNKKVSYVPPRYTYSYDFYIILSFNHPWFNEIKFKVNSSTIKDSKSIEYRDTEKQANEIRNVLTTLHRQVRTQAAEAAKPKTSVVCPSCGATTLPDQNGRCEYCGSAVAG